ncbi:MAG: MarR family transcriptional regulator [Oscillospiraceae bacterium]
MNERTECINLMYEIYPLSRKLVFDAFDNQRNNLTRTQQIIILALTVKNTMSMSQLAKKINTSNEQATRAVAQLVDKGFIRRSHDKNNRRIINICLTENAMEFFMQIKANIQDELLKRFDSISDLDMHNFHDALLEITRILKSIDK